MNFQRFSPSLFLTFFFWIVISFVATQALLTLLLDLNTLVLRGPGEFFDFFILSFLQLATDRSLVIFYPILILIALLFDYLVLRFKTLAKIMIFLSIICGLIFATLLVLLGFSCGKLVPDDLGCFVGFLYVYFYGGLFLFFTMSILPFAWIGRRMIDGYTNRLLLNKSLLPGLIIMILCSIMTLVSFAPYTILSVQSSKEDKQLAEKRAQEDKAKLQEKHRLLTPGYLPDNKIKKTEEESSESRYFVQYSCDKYEELAIHLDFSKTGELVEAIEDPRAVPGGQGSNITENVQISGKIGKFITKNYFDNEKNSTILWKYILIWQADDSQIVITAGPGCVLGRDPKSELVKIAESMQ